MILPLLIAIGIVLGIVVVYMKFIQPRMNPLNRADSYINQNMIDEAIYELKKVLDKEPDNSIANYRLAEIYLNRKEYDKAVVYLEKILTADKYEEGVERSTVQKRLAEIYLNEQEIDRAFEIYLSLLNSYPNDATALYHVSFISLGQEMFEFSYRYFARLANFEKKNFEVLFGAGIAAYQNQKTNDAIDYFRDALNLDPHSDIANLAMAFANQRKMDYRTALNYINMVVENSKDPNALFISKRLKGILLVQARKASDGVKVLEDLLADARINSKKDEISMLLYDLGFVALKAEMTDLAYEYWNQLYQHNRGHKDVQMLTTMLRKEMDEGAGASGVNGERSVVDYYEKWISKTFPQDFIWRICGLKNEKEIDLKTIVANVRVDSGGGIPIQHSSRKISAEGENNLVIFMNLDVENFRIISNRLMAKLGYRVDEILPTYREHDGVDFLSYSLADKQKVLVWVRRWKDTRVGDIPLRNFAQAINDIKAKRGLFITTTELTPSGETALRNLSKVSVIYPDQLGNLLTGML